MKYLQCSKNNYTGKRSYCHKHKYGNIAPTLKRCLDCEFSIITDRPFAGFNTKVVEYEGEKDNCKKELEKRAHLIGSMKLSDHKSTIDDYFEKVDPKDVIKQFKELGYDL